jgi:hypothetical protein
MLGKKLIKLGLGVWSKILSVWSNRMNREIGYIDSNKMVIKGFILESYIWN